MRSVFVQPLARAWSRVGTPTALQIVILPWACGGTVGSLLIFSLIWFCHLQSQER